MECLKTFWSPLNNGELNDSFRLLIGLADKRYLTSQHRKHRKENTCEVIFDKFSSCQCLLQTRGLS